MCAGIYHLRIDVMAIPSVCNFIHMRRGFLHEGKFVIAMKILINDHAYLLKETSRRFLDFPIWKYIN